MRCFRTSAWLRALGTLVLACMVSTAHAQPWPIKPVRLIVPHAPGGVTDDEVGKWAAVVKASGIQPE